jgi:hypothetical protein
MKRISHAIKLHYAYLSSAFQNLHELVQQETISQINLAIWRQQSVATMLRQKWPFATICRSYRKLYMLPSLKKEQINYNSMVQFWNYDSFIQKKKE